MDNSADSLSFSPTPSDTSKKGKNKRAFLIIVIAVILALGGYYFYSRSQQQSQQAQLTPTPEPTAEPTEEVTPTEGPTQTPAPTKKAEVKNATDMSLQVLNGSGEEGVAGTAKEFLEGKGYTSIETGNADNFDYQGVTIRIKSSMEKFLSSLQTDLKEKYTLASESGSLSEDALFDASIIIGK